MKLFHLLILGLLLTGCSAAAMSTADRGTNEECEEGWDLIAAPECPNDEENVAVFFPFPFDCTQYFNCTNGAAKCIKCAPGTIWDQENWICNPPEIAKCAITITGIPTTPTPKTTITITTSTTEDPATWVCPEGYDGLIRHPYDCRFFYLCDTVVDACLFECPNNLYFNPETEKCDWDLKVPDCQGGSPPPTSTTPTPGYTKSLSHRNNFIQTVKYVAKIARRMKGKHQIQYKCPWIKANLNIM